VFGVLDNIVVYPVEDENKYTDHFGNVLPDALLVRKGTTALQLAARIHTDLAQHMLYAIDAKKKLKVAKDYVLKDGDVIRIVSAAR
jgi:ribosome-binding ATPase YchF (GTP1/OBG family)